MENYRVIETQEKKFMLIELVCEETKTWVACCLFSNKKEADEALKSTLRLEKMNGRGRPKMDDDKKKARTSVSLSPKHTAFLAQLPNKSAFIEVLIAEYLENNAKYPEFRGE